MNFSFAPLKSISTRASSCISGAELRNTGIHILRAWTVPMGINHTRFLPSKQVFGLTSGTLHFDIHCHGWQCLHGNWLPHGWQAAALWRLQVTLKVQPRKFLKWQENDLLYSKIGYGVWFKGIPWGWDFSVLWSLKMCLPQQLSCLECDTQTPGSSWGTAQQEGTRLEAGSESRRVTTWNSDMLWAQGPGRPGETFCTAWGKVLVRGLHLAPRLQRLTEVIVRVLLCSFQELFLTGLQGFPQAGCYLKALPSQVKNKERHWWCPFSPGMTEECHAETLVLVLVSGWE